MIQFYYKMIHRDSIKSQSSILKLQLLIKSIALSIGVDVMGKYELTKHS
jgi:hypothetical protein